jgi:hypothetical protein
LAGFELLEPYPDWSGYHRLVFSVESHADRPIPLTVRVWDSRHRGDDDDRFDRRITIHPGRQQIDIPLDDVRMAPAHREMDMQRIRGLEVFFWQVHRPFDLALSPLQLQ